MSRKFRAGGLPVLVISLVGLSAASLAAESRELVSEPDYLAVWNERHPAIATARVAVLEAQSEALSAALLENPSLGWVLEEPGEDFSQTDWSLSWQLPGPDRGARIRARESGAEAAAARFASQALDLRRELRAVYAAWAIASSRLEILTAQAEEFRVLAERERARAERGEVSGLDAHRLALASTEWKTKVALAKREEREALVRARTWNPEVGPRARPELPELRPVETSERPHALERAAEAELEAAQAELDAAGRFVALPEVSLGWQVQDGARGVSQDGPTFGLGWTVPLFNRNQATKALVEARREGAEAHLAMVRAEWESRRSEARGIYEDLATAAGETFSSLVIGEEIWAGAELSFRHGETSLTDLLDMARSLAEARLGWLELHGQALEAARQLDRLNTPSEFSFEISQQP